MWCSANVAYCPESPRNATWRKSPAARHLRRRSRSSPHDAIATSCLLQRVCSCFRTSAAFFMDRAFIKFSRHHSSLLTGAPDPLRSCNSPLRCAVYERQTARRERWSPCGSESNRCRASASVRCDWLLGLYQILSAESNATTEMAS